MKIKFLGTSAGWPLPRLGCKCPICTSKDPKDTRTRTQLLLNDSILLDAGPDSYQHLIKTNLSQTLNTILVTHEHPDHILGFQDLTHLYNFKNKITLFVTKPVLTAIKRIFPFPLNPVIVKVVEQNKPFYVNNVKVEYFPVVHNKTPAWGIKLKGERIFIYIPDFNRILPSQDKIVKHANCWAIDGSSLDKLGQGPGHISITDGIVLAKKFKIKSTYFVHIGHKTGTHQFLEEYLKQNAGANFHIAYDGLKINL